ncbi:hypothetical protein OF83DRAFT_1163098 [Amylostereum chailletii]|nr:hypothetical protein OF83DRAFT_1163098 [Amylostereum chailletii]
MRQYSYRWHKIRVKRFQDPLSVVTHLISSDKEGCDDILALMSECSSAKEMNIVLQEVLERLVLEPDGSEEEEGEATSRISHAGQLSRIVDSYAAVVPRIKSRKTPSDSLQPILTELQKAVLPATSHITTKEARELIDGVSHLVRKASAWANDASSPNGSHNRLCNSILASLLDTTIEACVNAASTSIAQRLFEARFPRLVLRSSIRTDWEEGEKAMRSAIEASTSLDRSFDSLLSLQTMSSLILVAHSSSNQLSMHSITPLFPVLLTSLQSNIALDEALAILFTVLYPPSPSSPQGDLPQDVIIPLSTILPPLCSAHPDPATRHLTFRLLGQLLRLTPSPLRLQILTDLLAPADDAFPQMRIAAIGLLKEAALDALSSHGAPTGTPSVFASPLLLQTIGPYVFRTDPPTLLDSGISVKEFMESPEPTRLVESLGLYYVLLLRDSSNKTGIRDADMVRNIETSFLGPLRLSVCSWLNDNEISSDLHEILPLASLQTSIERIDEALNTISL